MVAKLPNTSSEIPCNSKTCVRVIQKNIFFSNITFGTKNCKFFKSDPPHEAISIMNPLTHLNTSSARFVHHATVISYEEKISLKIANEESYNYSYFGHFVH